MVEESKDSKSLSSEQQNIWFCSYDHLIGNNAFDTKYNIKSIQAEWMQIENFGLSISNAPNTHVILSRKPGNVYIYARLIPVNYAIEIIKSIGNITSAELNEIKDSGESKIINADHQYGRLVCLGKHNSNLMYTLTDSKWAALNEVPNSIHYMKDWFEGIKEHIPPLLAVYYMYNCCLAENSCYSIFNELLKISDDSLSITGEVAFDLLELPQIDEKEKVPKWKGKSDEELWKNLIQ